MQIGVVFPQTELGGDVGAVRAYVRRVEELGYRHVLAYDHVVGADPAVHSGWSGPYDVTAEVDLLSGGRFRLGIGLGWNAVEYEALGQDFSSRGRRSEEQVDLLRRLWTEPSVTFEGRFDRVTGAGLAPLPVQRPIPIWFGGQSERAYRRIGRLADGWFPQAVPGPQLDEARGVVEQAAREAGRDPAVIGMEGRVSWHGDPGPVAELAASWRDAGATHLSVNTMGAGLRDLEEHLGALEAAAKVLKPAGE
jgi:hypothetical protein